MPGWRAQTNRMEIANVMNRLVLSGTTAFWMAACLGGCNNPSATPPLEDGSQVTPPNKTKQLMGTVLHKTWSKTPESWNAGGSDYFVLDVGDAQVEERSAEKGVILRPSESVSFGEFNRYVGKAVRVQGEYVKATPYVPKDEMEQYPIGPDGNPQPTGSGFKAVVIELLR